MTEMVFSHTKVRCMLYQTVQQSDYPLIQDLLAVFTPWPIRWIIGHQYFSVIALALILQLDLVLIDEHTTALNVVVQLSIIRKIKCLRGN